MGKEKWISSFYVGLAPFMSTFSSRLPSSAGGAYEEARVGTTAEIYEYRDPPADSNEVGFKIKVRGRQRFRVLSSRSQIDG